MDLFKRAMVTGDPEIGQKMAEKAKKKSTTTTPTLPCLPTAARPLIKNHEDFHFTDPSESEPDPSDFISDTDPEAAKKKDDGKEESEESENDFDDSEDNESSNEESDHDADDEDEDENLDENEDEDEIEEETWPVEKLLKSKIVDGQIEYLVKWKGWGHKFNSWEPKENIADPMLIEIFEKSGKK